MTDHPGENTDHDMKHRDSMLGAAFPSTQWTMIFKAQQSDAEAALALNELCRRYWYPIYAYLRCRGFERPDAQDLTQSFFLSAIEGGLIRHADPLRGKMRSFLLGALTRHIADHLRHQHAQKRGGRAIVLPLECQTAEEKFSSEPVDHRDPESLFLSSWARELLDRVRVRLRDHYTKTGRADLYDALQAAVELDDEIAPYRDLSARLNASEAALRIQVFRMRQRFAKLLREEVALTVETPEEIEEELAWLSRVLRD